MFDILESTVCHLYHCIDPDHDHDNDDHHYDPDLHHDDDDRSGSSFDILESTAWIREVVVHSQKKRKGFHRHHHHFHHHCLHGLLDHHNLYHFHPHIHHHHHNPQELGSFAVSVFRLLALGRGSRRFIKSLLVNIMLTNRMMRIFNKDEDDFDEK